MHPRQRVVFRQQGGMHAHIERQRLTLPLPLGHRQQLHHVAQLGGVSHVTGLEAIDALGGDRLAGHRAAIGQARQDRDLVGGIAALHIGSRIGLGITQPLGIGEHVAIGGALISHAAEDVIRGAIDDAAHPLDAVAPKRLLQRLDDRDAAAHRRLNQHIHAALGGGRGNLLAVAGDHRLVRGHHRLAGGNRPQDQAAGRLQAAHHLHHDLHGRIVDHRLGAGGEQLRIEFQGAGAVEIAHRHPAQRQFSHQGMAALRTHEDRGHARPHCSQPQQANTDRHGPQVPQRSDPRNAGSCPASRIMPLLFVPSPQGLV